jgi:hypothetical protein
MATMLQTFEISKIKPVHLGAVLLGRYLEQGFLRIDLTEGEMKHFVKEFGWREEEVPDELYRLMNNAAKRLGIASTIAPVYDTDSNQDVRMVAAPYLVVWDNTRKYPDVESLAGP